jgi:hypothetical protein
MATDQIIRRPRHDVADIYRLAGFGIGRETKIGGIMLEIEHIRDRLRRAGQPRMIDHVGNALPIHPDFARTPQPFQILFAGTCGHNPDLRMTKQRGGQSAASPLLLTELG